MHEARSAASNEQALVHKFGTSGGTGFWSLREARGSLGTTKTLLWGSVLGARPTSFNTISNVFCSEILSKSQQNEIAPSCSVTIALPALHRAQANKVLQGRCQAKQWQLFASKEEYKFLCTALGEPRGGSRGLSEDGLAGLIEISGARGVGTTPTFLWAVDAWIPIFSHDFRTLFVPEILL